MAWQSNEIGGYKNSQLDTSNQRFEAGFSQGGTQLGKTGIKWSDILGAALQYGSKPGSSGPGIGALMQRQYGGTGIPNQPTPQQTAGIAPLMGTQKQQAGFESIMPLLMKLIGQGA